MVTGLTEVNGHDKNRGYLCLIKLCHQQAEEIFLSVDGCLQKQLFSQFMWNCNVGL